MEHINRGEFKKEFFEFLERKEVKEQYMFNLNNTRTGIGITGIGNEIPQNYLTAAFTWRDGSEPEGFWSKIDDMWQQELLKLKNHES